MCYVSDDEFIRLASSKGQFVKDIKNVVEKYGGVWLVTEESMAAITIEMRAKFNRPE